MRAKSIFLLMLALVCGVVASVGITQVISGRGTETAPQGETQPIFIAVKDIPMGDPVSMQMVKLEEWPKELVPKGAISKVEDLENRRPKSRIFANSPILDNQLLGKGTLDQGASDVIPKGFRVIAVKVDAVSGSASLIRPGDRVDVLVHINQNGAGVGARNLTKTILQDIKVFAVNDVWDMATTSGEKSIVAKTISLLVSPSQAEKVTLGSEMGQIRLVMRSPDDKDQTKLAGVAAQDVLGGEFGGLDRQPSGNGAAGPSAITGFLSLLNSNKSKSPSLPQAAPQTPAQAKPESFAMRVLEGDRMNELVMESTGDPEASRPSDSSFMHWRVGGSARGAQPAMTVLKPATAKPSATPAVKPVDKPAPAGDPDSDDNDDDLTGKNIKSVDD